MGPSVDEWFVTLSGCDRKVTVGFKKEGLVPRRVLDNTTNGQLLWGVTRVHEVCVPHFVHPHAKSDMPVASSVGPGLTQDPPLLAPACAEPPVTAPHERLRRGGGRDTFVRIKSRK